MTNFIASKATLFTAREGIMSIFATQNAVGSLSLIAAIFCNMAIF